MARLAQKVAARMAMRYGKTGRGMMPGTAMMRVPGGMLNDYGMAGDSIFKKIGKVLGKIALPVLRVIPGVGNIVSAVEGGIGAVKAAAGKKSKTAGPSGVALGQSRGIQQAGFGIPSLEEIRRMLTPQFTNPLQEASMVPGHSSLARTLGVGSVNNIPKGYKLNKSRYYIDDPLIPGSEQGREIEPGSRIVKIRHRNPFNPKAASRAMSRLSALHHGMKALERNLRKLAPPARHLRAAAPGRKR